EDSTRDFALFPRTYVSLSDGFDESERETAVTDDLGGEAGAAHDDGCGICRHGSSHCRRLDRGNQERCHWQPPQPGWGRPGSGDAAARGRALQVENPAAD